MDGHYLGTSKMRNSKKELVEDSLSGCMVRNRRFQEEVQNGKK
jgi:hypothetical protein